LSTAVMYRSRRELHLEEHPGDMERDSINELVAREARERAFILTQLMRRALRRSTGRMITVLLYEAARNACNCGAGFKKNIDDAEMDDRLYRHFSLTYDNDRDDR
jgi:hypothetical protein